MDEQGALHALQMEDLTAGLGAHEYDTKTQGRRRVEAARALGEGAVACACIRTCQGRHAGQQCCLSGAEQGMFKKCRCVHHRGPWARQPAGAALHLLTVLLTVVVAQSAPAAQPLQISLEWQWKGLAVFMQSKQRPVACLFDSPARLPDAGCVKGGR